MKKMTLRTGLKRLFALFCTLFLVVGLVSPNGVKAAGEVNTTLTFDGFANQSNLNRWLIYASLGTPITATISSNEYLGWAMATMNDSTEEFSMDVYASSNSRIFYVMPYSKLGVSTPSELQIGTTVTIKPRTFSGYLIGQNAFTIYWTGTAWKELQKLPLSTISSQQQVVLTTTNSVLQTLFDSKGNTNDMPLAGVGNACVYLNGKPTSKTTINYSRWGLYLDATSIKGSNYAVGDELTIQGIFSQSVNSNVYYEMDEGFVCIATSSTNGATWAYKSELSIKENAQGTLYLGAGEIISHSGDYNVFGANEATITYNGQSISRASNNYFLYSASKDALRIYLAEYGITEQTAGDIIHISGSFSCNGKIVNFGENWFVLQSDGTWLHTTEEPEGKTRFTITEGSYTYQDWSNLNRWSMKFVPSKSLGTPSQLTYLGDYKTVLNGTENTAPYYVTTSGDLQMFISRDMIPQLPIAGTRVTIPAQEFGDDYELTESYNIIYDNGWKTLIAYADVPLSVHSSWGNQAQAATIMPTEGDSVSTNASVVAASGAYFKPLTEDAGIWYNGEKLDVSKGLKLVNGTTYVRYQIVLADYGLTVSKHDMITVKGLFGESTSGVYLNMTEIHLKYNGSSWETVSYGYDALTVFLLQKLLDAQHQEGTLNRWLFKMQPSVTLEAATASWGTDYAGYSGNMDLRIYHEDTPDAVVETTSTALHAQINGEDGYFGLIIPYTTLPMDADGYVVEIQSGIFKSANYTYKLEAEFVLKNVGGTWEVVMERPQSTGIKGDANGDGVVNSLDVVREKLELSDEALCTEDAFLNEKKAMLRKVDLISLYELILRDGEEENTMPIYLEDDEIMLAAYEGPRSGGKTNYHYENGNLKNDGTVSKSYLNATEFERFARAGLNTVYVQADASFDSKALRGANDAMLKNLNTYMDLAADADIDVIVYSDYLNSYLKGGESKTWDGTSLDMNAENLKIELDELWNGHANANGMKKYENFKGIMMSDELKSSQVDEYEAAVNVMKGISEDIGFYSSQLPMTASSLDFSGNTAVDRFINSAKTFGSLSNHFIYDLYPLRTNSNGTNPYVKKEWLQNLEVSAATGRDNGFSTGITIQSMGQGRNPLIHEYLRGPEKKEDIGFQVYTSLAYGMKSITYYTYWEHHAQYATINAFEAYTNAMVLYPDDPEAENAEGVETDIYRAVAAVNNEINKFDHVFMEYDWLGVIPLSVQNSDDLYDNLDKTYSSSRISASTATADALIGCMYDPTQGYDGFWLVNGTAPNNATDSKITVKFNDTTKLMVYNPTEIGFDGRAKIVSYDAANGYTAELACGEGQFVIPLR